jgi:hypothetical protein
MSYIEGLELLFSSSPSILFRFCVFNCFLAIANFDTSYLGTSLLFYSK